MTRQAFMKGVVHNTMTFKAKKDTLYRIIALGSGLLFLGLAIGLFVPLYNEANLFVSLIFFIIFGGFGLVIFWFWFSTHYVLTEDTLIIKYGPFKKEISLSAIKKIEKTYQPVASIALARERYIVQYNVSDMMIISPERIDEFLNLLQERTSHSIEIKK